MRKFTKTHNELKWLFPICKTDKEAEEKFDEVEELGKYIASHTSIDEKDQDLALDCFMKGYSEALQMESQALVERYIDNIYKNLLNLTDNYLDDEKERERWFKFHHFEELIKELAYNRPDNNTKKRSEYLVKLLENSGFNADGPIEERKKMY